MQLLCESVVFSFPAYVDSTLLLSDSYINVKRVCMQSEVEAISLLPNKKAIGALAQSKDFALLCLPKQEVGHLCSEYCHRLVVIDGS